MRAVTSIGNTFMVLNHWGVKVYVNCWCISLERNEADVAYRRRLLEEVEEDRYMPKVKLEVIQILKEEGEFAHVILSYPLFDALRGVNRSVPATVARTAEGQPVQVYTVDGTKIYARTDRSNPIMPRTVFIMKTADAQAHLVQLVSSEILGFTDALMEDTRRAVPAA